MRSQHYTSNSVRLGAIPEIRRANGSGFDGYLYVIEFSTGTLKAGRSNNPRGRVATHLDHARKFGATISRLWLSVPHANYKENEQLLLKELGKPSHGAEYFESMGFDDAVAIAESALHFHVLTDEERSELETEQKRRTEERIQELRKWTGRPDLVQVALDPDIDSWITSLLFGNSRTLPEIQADPDPEDAHKAITIVSEATGIDRAEIAEWSFLDVIEFMGRQQVSIGIAKLKLLAYETGRLDLVSPGFYLSGAEAQS